MKLKQLNQEKIDNMAMIDIATKVLEEEKKALDFRKIFDRVAKLKGFSEADKDIWISQFYTDLNIDGRFMTKGSNLWGLKKWYPVEEIDEDITPEPKKKKKKKKAVKKKAPVEEVDESEDLDETIVEKDAIGFDDDLESDTDIVDDDFDFDDDDDLEDDIDDDLDTEDDEEEK